MYGHIARSYPSALGPERNLMHLRDLEGSVGHTRSEAVWQRKRSAFPLRRYPPNVVMKLRAVMFPYRETHCYSMTRLYGTFDDIATLGTSAISGRNTTFGGHPRCLVKHSSVCPLIWLCHLNRCRKHGYTLQRWYHLSRKKRNEDNEQHSAA